MMDQIFSKLRGDKWIWIIVIILSGWSLLAVYSSVGTLAYKEGKGTELYLFKHFSSIAISIVLMDLSYNLGERYCAGRSKLLRSRTLPCWVFRRIGANRVTDGGRSLPIPVITQTVQTLDSAKQAL